MNINTNATYTAIVAPTNTSPTFLWEVLSGGTIQSGQGTSSVVIRWVTVGSHTIRLTVSNSCSTPSPVTRTVVVEDPSVEGPIAPIVTFQKDVFASYWLQDPNDWKNCDSINPNYPQCNPTISGQQAIDAGRTVKYNPNARSNGAESRLKNYAYRNLTKPVFYAEYQAVNPINDGNGNSGNTDYNIRFTQEAFDKTLEYCFESGMKGFDFYFYDETDSDVAEHIAFNRTTTSQYAQYVSYYYTLGSLGFRANPTIDRIVADMGSSRYYKYGGRPVINIDTPEDTKFHVDRWILQSGATYHDDGTEQYWTQNSGYSGPIYVADRNGAAPAPNTVPASGETPVITLYDVIKNRYAALHGGVEPWMYVSGGYFYHPGNVSGSNATSTYGLVTPNCVNDHSYTSLSANAITEANSAMSTQDTVPVIITGWNNIYADSGQQPCWLASATPSELTTAIGDMKNLVNSNPSRVPFVKIYSFGETAEAGGGALVPRLNTNGTIDKDLILAVRAALTA